MSREIPGTSKDFHVTRSHRYVHVKNDLNGKRHSVLLLPIKSDK